MGADYTRMRRRWQLSGHTIAQKSSWLHLFWPIGLTHFSRKVLFLWLFRTMRA